jgi:hypothetical protein
VRDKSLKKIEKNQTAELLSFSAVCN